jgi:protein arginine kinase
MDAFDDIAVSTRIRLARNLKEYPFPGRMSEQQEREVLDGVSSYLTETAGGAAFRFVDLSEQDPITIGSMVERHLISPELATRRGSRGVVLSGDDSVCIMINEEDHLRIQSILSGLRLDACMETVNRLDDLLEGRFQYAWNDQLGYLTHCPTNLGTGLRASVMLHLPAHTETGEIRALIMNLGKLGFAVRGLYGEGSKATGSLYQISNQLTLGLSEPDTIERLNEVVRSTIERERTLRRSISQKSPLSLEDRIWRAYGILSYARRITGEEAMNLLSDLRTGISMGYFKDISLTDLNHLLSNIQSNSICHAEGKPLTELERDTKRAALIQTLLKNETTDQDKDAENG